MKVKLTDEQHVANNKARRGYQREPVIEVDSEFEEQCRTRFVNKRVTARRLGIPFELEFEDVVFPMRCPVLGIELNYNFKRKAKGGSFDSPSFDRIDPEGGYTKGNTHVISMKANSIKGSASVAELILIANYFKQSLLESNQ